MLTIRHLRIFVAVATTGKMCDAADELFISQPTVSQAIKELEDHFKELLFERLGRKLYITPFGEKLLFYSRNLLNDFDELERNMFEIGSQEEITIGASITVGKCILPQIINDLKATNSNMKIYSRIENTRKIEEKILKSELDIGIVEGHISNPNIVTIPAMCDFLVLACNKNHSIANLPELNIEALNNLDFAFREKGSGTRELFENYIHRQNININIVSESNCPDSIKTLILENNYISVMSIRLIEEEIKNNLIEVFYNKDDSWKRTIKIVYHKDKLIDSTLEKFIKIVRSQDKKPIFMNQKRKYIKE